MTLEEKYLLLSSDVSPSPPVVDHVDCLNAFQMTINTPCTTISNNGAGFLVYILHVMSIYTMMFGFLSLLRRPKKYF
ncbi:MAG: hypothetical protein IPP49_15455 [Saprospiraceae bacterium]|nr:hypothetical protein [Saprospiraceae bacterium]